jgi:hypothetical protein
VVDSRHYDGLRFDYLVFLAEGMACFSVLLEVLFLLVL